MFEKNIYTTGGLIFLEYYVVLIDAILGPVLWLVNP